MSIITNTVRDVNDTLSGIEQNSSLLKVLKHSIPDELKRHPHWAPWDETPRPNGGVNKIPRDAHGNYLKTNLTNGWLSFDKVISIYEAGQ